MNPESWGFIGTLFGAIVGASTSILTTRINSRNAVRIQRDLEQNKRDERFREFQRDNLIKLQDEIANCINLMIKAHIEDLEYFKHNNDWQSTALSEELNKKLTQAIRQFSIIIERIDDDILRVKLYEFRKSINNSLISKNYDKSLSNINDISKRFNGLMQDIGEELRKNY